ncbi:hypothetical protein Tco_1418475 [Tanacetum coccineum]
MAALRYRDEHNKVEAQVEVPSQEATVEDVEVPSNIASKAQQTASSLKKVGTKKKLLGIKVRGLRVYIKFVSKSIPYNKPYRKDAPIMQLENHHGTVWAEVVPKSVAGSSFPAATFKQSCSVLILLKGVYDEEIQICAEVSCVQVKTQADWMLLYVVPTGRYVVPAGKVIIIVSPGRLSLVPTGRILSPGRVK